MMDLTNQQSHNPIPNPTQYTPDQHTNNINQAWVQNSTQNITKKQGLNITGPCVIILTLHDKNWGTALQAGMSGGSIPDCVIGIFHWHNPSVRTMALGLTQHLQEMNTRCISWGVKAAGAWGWQHYHHPVPLSWNLGASTSWNPHGLSRPLPLWCIGALYSLQFCLNYNEQRV
jgi:hypothetical protein